MSTKLTVNIVKITQHDEMQPYAYISKSGSAYVKHTPMTLYMKIWAKDQDGNDYFFKTPGFNYSKASGFLDYKSFDNNNAWFKEVKGTIKGHKGAAMFDGGIGPNICISDDTHAVPTVSIGDKIEIKASASGTGKPNNVYSKGLIFLNRVKLNKVL